MCGIAGVIALAAENGGDGASAHRMISAIRHRGPDEVGVYAKGRVALGHARLSIVDLEGGRQPMETPDGQAVVVFNGEIFNHVELRAELEALGQVFQTRSDTEVLLRAYLQWGEDCVQRFNGQWSFALWDARERKLFASRDRLGVRPFFFTRTPQAFVFASELKSLFAHPSVTRELDPRGLDQILTFWTTVPPRTMFRGVQELPPGHSLRLVGSELSVYRYWALGFADPITDRSEDDLAEELRQRLIDAARLRLQRADVPVGAYLSGGLDSTIVTAVASRFTDVPLRTFSVTFEDKEFDESSFQRQVIDHLGVDHHQVLCTTEDIGRVFPDVVWHTEQPLIRTAPAPMFLLSKLVRENGYKVVLTGEGSDELLGGYDIFKEAKVRRFMAKQPDSSMRPSLLRRLYPYMPGIQRQSPAYLQAFFHVTPDDLESPGFSHLPRWRLTERIKMFYSDALKSDLTGYDSYQDLYGELPKDYGRWDPFYQAQYLESRYLLPGYLLSSQGDRAAMAHGVEGRYPFLDYRVVELAARIPPRLKMRVLNEKYLLKRAFGDLIPPILRKRPKQPYRAPDASSFFDGQGGRARFDYVEELLSDEAIARTGAFNPKAVRSLVQKARHGKIVGVKDGMALVAILSTQLVLEQFINRVGKLGDVQRH